MPNKIFIKGRRTRYEGDPIRKQADHPPPMTIGGIVVNGVYHVPEIVRHSTERQEDLTNFLERFGHHPERGLKIQGVRTPKRSGWQSSEK